MKYLSPFLDVDSMVDVGGDDVILECLQGCEYSHFRVIIILNKIKVLNYKKIESHCHLDI